MYCPLVAPFIHMHEIGITTRVHNQASRNGRDRDRKCAAVFAVTNVWYVASSYFVIELVMVY